MNFLHDLNRHLRDRRVPRKCAAVFTAATQREIQMVVKCSNGTQIARADSVKSPTDKKRFTEIKDNLRLLGIPEHSANRLLDMVAYEMQLFKLTEASTEEYELAEYVDEAIRTVMVEKGIINEEQFADGIEAKYPFPEAA